MLIIILVSIVFVLFCISTVRSFRKKEIFFAYYGLSASIVSLGALGLMIWNYLTYGPGL